MRVVAAAMLLGLAACGGSSAEELSVEGQSYSFPSAHILSIVRQPHSFVRLDPPERQFSLVYDSRMAGAQGGPGIPKIFSVNDEGQSRVEYLTRGRQLIICRRAVHPKGGCGAMIDHRGTQWAVLFPIDQLGQAEALLREAQVALDGYRK